MKISKNRLLVGVIVMVLGVSVAHAAERSSYVGFSLGTASSDNSLYESALGWRIFVGQRLGRNFSLQLGYVDFGEMSGPPGTLGGTKNLSSSGFDFSVTGRYPFADRFAVSARLGLLVWDSKWSNSGPTGGDTGTGNSTMLYGLGGSYDYSERIGFQANWDHYSLTDDTTVFSVGIVYRY